MPSATDRTEFAPPRPKRSWGSFVLAVLVHLVLIAALTWGVNWKSTDQTASFEAELWSATPQLAAPKPAVVAPPTPSPAPVPAPAPTPEPKPVPPPPPKPDPVPEPKVAPTLPDVDIALEQEKKRKLQQQQKEAEVRKAEKLKEQRDAELQAKKEKEKEKEIEKKKEKDRKVHEEQVKQAAQDAKEQEKKKQAVAAAAAAEKVRADNLKRIMGQAGATGAADAKGTADKSAGPKGNSKTYAAIVQAAIKPNVVFTDEITGNPVAKIEVRVTLDGTIISHRLLASSGNKAWDDAAMKAIVRTAVMPKDVDGRLPDTILNLEMRPKD